MPRLHVLVVDDEEGNRESLAMLLAAHDMRVEQSQSAKGALAKLLDHASIDLIISDVAMPEMDGVDFARQARQLRPNVPLILLTGNDSVVDRVVRQGSIALLKPYEPDRLLSLIEEAVGRQA
jgi:CheY-like chemotaxis protein